MVRGWVLLLGLACCVRVLHGQVVAEGDLGKVQTAWGKTIASETLKMSRQSESEVDTGVVDKEPLTSTDSVMVQIRNNEDGTTDIYAEAELVRETTINVEMVIWDEENFVRVLGTDSEETAEEWISGEEIATLKPANVDEVIDPSITIQEVEDIINSDNVESIEIIESRDVSGVSASCYKLSPTAEYLTKQSPDSSDATVTNEVCVNEASGKLVEVTGSIKEAIPLADEEEGETLDLAVTATYTYTFFDFGETVEFPARFIEEAEQAEQPEQTEQTEEAEGADQAEQMEEAEETEETQNIAKNSARSAAVSFVLVVGGVMAATVL